MVSKDGHRVYGGGNSMESLNQAPLPPGTADAMEKARVSEIVRVCMKEDETERERELNLLYLETQTSAALVLSAFNQPIHTLPLLTFPCLQRELQAGAYATASAAASANTPADMEHLMQQNKDKLNMLRVRPFLCVVCLA